MLLLTHILIAMLSLIGASLAFVRPSKVAMKANYALVAGTLVSGSALILAGASIISTCLTGLVYLAVVATFLALAKRKLAFAYARIK